TMPAGTSIEVKEGTVSISPAAFSGCTGLSSIIIPSSVTSIGVSAFSSFTNLTSVKFEETTGWAVANSADGERTPIAESEFTTDASAANANLLKSTYSSKYWFRTVA
ncbi:MAG: leucine-rich repeat protein, partial [Clostridia bacterium]|nr:leucine-rich repeat protein [Clostridia bacterium]